VGMSMLGGSKRKLREAGEELEAVRSQLEVEVAEKAALQEELLRCSDEIARLSEEHIGQEARADKLEQKLIDEKRIQREAEAALWEQRFKDMEELLLENAREKKQLDTLCETKLKECEDLKAELSEARAHNKSDDDPSSARLHESETMAAARAELVLLRSQAEARDSELAQVQKERDEALERSDSIRTSRIKQRELADSCSDEELVHGTFGGRSMEREIDVLKKTNLDLQRQIDELSSGSKRKILKKKSNDFAKRLQTEREVRAKREAELEKANERIEALSKHLEKLMLHLKHESAGRSAAVNDMKSIKKELSSQIQRNEKLSRKLKARDKMLNEMREGARILEDQLRLMDQKYVQLRSKLDWTRATSNREVKRVQKQANQLRASFALAFSQAGVSLDPSKFSKFSANNTRAEGDDGNRDDEELEAEEEDGFDHEVKAGKSIEDQKTVSLPLL